MALSVKKKSTKLIKPCANTRSTMAKEMSSFISSRCRSHLHIEQMKTDIPSVCHIGTYIGSRYNVDV